MLRMPTLLAGCLLIPAVAWGWQGTTTQAPTGAKGQAGVGQHVTRTQGEVEHLQKDVGQQETVNQQAAERLQEQDRIIAALRKQLDEAKTDAGKAPAEH